MMQCIIDLTALYTNYKHTGLWYKTVPNHKAQIIVLATHFKEKMDAEKSTRKNNPSNPNPAANQSGAGKIGKWLFEDVGPTLCGPDKENYACCPLYGRKTDGCTATCTYLRLMTTKDGRPVRMPSSIPGRNKRRGGPLLNAWLPLNQLLIPAPKRET